MSRHAPLPGTSAISDAIRPPVHDSAVAITRPRDDRNPTTLRGIFIFVLSHSGHGPITLCASKCDTRCACRYSKRHADCSTRWSLHRDAMVVCSVRPASWPAIFFAEAAGASARRFADRYSDCCFCWAQPHATVKEATPMMFPTIVINREDPASMDAQT